jgi:hypothetical protein
MEQHIVVPNVRPITTSLVLATTNGHQVVQQERTTTKKKCRGDRKRQRYRRQLYSQGLDSTTVDKLVEEKLSSQVHSQQQFNNAADESQESDIRNIDVFIPLDRVS